MDLERWTGKGSGELGEPVFPLQNSMVARARSTDPATSHQAARTVERSGTAGSQRIMCLAAVRVRPGLTAAEIAWETGLERHIPSRRLPELRDGGLVVNGPSRICTVMGTPSMTWVPVDERN